MVTRPVPTDRWALTRPTAHDAVPGSADSLTTTKLTKVAGARVGPAGTVVTSTDRTPKGAEARLPWARIAIQVPIEARARAATVAMATPRRTRDRRTGRSSSEGSSDQPQSSPPSSSPQPEPPPPSPSRRSRSSTDGVASARVTSPRLPPGADGWAGRSLPCPAPGGEAGPMAARPEPSTGEPDATQPDSIERAFRLGEDLAVAPLRLLSGLTAPFRDDIGRTVRRSFGISETPRPRAMDPDTAFVHPDSVVRVVHSDLGAMMIGGLAALMLQALHPLAMAGVADHSSYEEDPIGRLRRTANFVGTTTFGTTAEAHAAIRLVQAVHRRVRGVAPDGRPYSADDPDLLTWVHAAEMYCFLEATQRYGSRRLSGAECDSYYCETAPVAVALGAEWVPRSRRRWTRTSGESSPSSTQALRPSWRGTFSCAGSPASPRTGRCTRWSQPPASACCPRWARRKMRIPALALFDAAVTPPARLLCAGLRWAVPPRR